MLVIKNAISNPGLALDMLATPYYRVIRLNVDRWRMRSADSTDPNSARRYSNKAGLYTPGEFVAINSRGIFLYHF
jgi:hypothetical protein